MQFLCDIGSVVSIAGDHDLARQTLGQGPARALVVLRTAMHGGKMELAAFHQHDAGLYAAKVQRNTVNDGIEQLIEF